ncbi:nitroreductase [Polycladomyces abyssicola]|uniref:Nitroreductase n=1 Tax=Polycladomyces abyssicola TaxID=1125966 RepID=A0A8D5UEM9_9BACL|nr:nitroreductase family protein [Polycladomyces abyssicola]BCU81298.1 nitroreductase [Polycladomyces abyssicola]
MTLSVKEAIESRRSIREYEQKPIPRADLQEILWLAHLAPSAWNVQPWRLIVVTDPELKSQLQEAAYGQKQVGSAPAVIVVTSDMEDVLQHPREFAHPNMPPEAVDRLEKTILDTFGSQSVEQRGAWGAAQTYIFLGFLLIAAKGMGYDTSPMLGFDPVKVRRLLNLADHVQIPALVAIGKGAEPGYPHHRHSLDRIVTYR